MSKDEENESVMSRSQSAKENEMAEEKDASRKLSRKDFVKGAAALAGAGALVSCAPAATPAPAETPKPCPTCPPAEECPTPWLPAKWDEETDVVVIGYGGAGVSAAIAAHDAGADVLVLEKAPLPDGGNFGCSGGYTALYSPVADFITVMTMACWGTVTDDELIAATCTEITKNPDWVESLGGKVNVEPAAATDSWRLPRTLLADFLSPDFALSNCRLEKADGTVGRGVDLFAFLHGCATDRGINVMLETPAKELIQNPATKEILGVKAVTGGKEIYVKAKRGVVMALGGYENNPEMRRNFLHECHSENVTFWGTPYNTGDGIFMASRVGAKLWHMSMGEALGSDFGCKPAIEEIGFGVNMKSNADPGCIFVNRYGRRFWNEHIYTGHSSRTLPTEYFDEEFVQTDPRDFCDYPNVPFYMIFDDTVMKAGPLSTRAAETATSGYLGIHQRDGLGTGYWWSEDNQTELAKGWIIKGDTIEELGGKITCKDYFGRVVGMDAAALAKTVNDYNSYCATGIDPDFGRQESSLVPINTPPFYAVELVTGHLNTNGGPVHNKYSQTMDVDGEPIPRLYSAGEFGSIFGFLYYGGGNVPEAMAMGRIAGEQAAGLEPWE
jgi:succinate dehydrogenase/fumarate reductase flavoprotein subunit